MRRNGRFYSSLLKVAGDPEQVAQVIHQALTTNTPRLRYVVGRDAEQLSAGRERISDEEWLSLGEDLSDEEYARRFRACFGFDL
jgi:hypothetical protein